MNDLCVDPLNPCPPIGAMYATFGVHAALPLSHGASGCCRFQRMEISKHFQKTVRVPSSLLRDRAATFGGESELREAVGNAFRLYDPDVIVVHTTCLSETIGDDVEGMMASVDVPDGKAVAWASTPGYAGSHLLGYDATAAAIIDQLAAPAAGAAFYRGARSVALVPGWMNPVDVDEAARYASAFFGDVLVAPDVRGVFDMRTDDDPRRYARGGATRETLSRMPSCACGIALGEEATARSSAALGRALGTRPVRRLGLPVGISATDAYIATLAELSGAPAPEWLACERRQAVDRMLGLADALYGLRAAIVCDADLAVGLASLCADAGIDVVCAAVGDARPDFERRVREAGRMAEDSLALSGVDRLQVEDALADASVDIVLGDTRNKRLAARLGAPLVRVGFPVVDRPLAFTEPVACYAGVTSLLRRIAGARLDAAEAVMAPEDMIISRYF